MSVLLLWSRSCNLQSLHCPRQPAYCLFGSNWFKSVWRDLCVHPQGQNAENALPWFSKEDFHLDATLAGMGTLQSEVPLGLQGSSKRARMSLKNLLEVNPSWKKFWLDLNFVPRRADLKSRDAKACCTTVAERQSTMCDSAQLLFLKWQNNSQRHKSMRRMEILSPRRSLLKKTSPVLVFAELQWWWRGISPSQQQRKSKNTCAGGGIQGFKRTRFDRPKLWGTSAWNSERTWSDSSRKSRQTHAGSFWASVKSRNRLDTPEGTTVSQVGEI